MYVSEAMCACSWPVTRGLEEKLAATYVLKSQSGPNFATQAEGYFAEVTLLYDKTVQASRCLEKVERVRHTIC